MLLNCHTYYSLCYGTFSIDELLKSLKTNGYERFALTDINNTSATVDTFRMVRNYGLTPIVGIDFRNGIQQQYIGLAKNNHGYKILNNHLSYHQHNQKDFAAQAPHLEDVFIIYPYRTYAGWPLKDYEYVGISYTDLTKFQLDNKQLNDKKIVILQTISFPDKKGFNAHRLLRAIDKNMLLSKLPPEEQGTLQEVVLPYNTLRAYFAEHPLWINNTEKILASCHFHIEFGKFANKNLHHYTNSVEEDIELLRKIAIEGLHYRYQNPSSVVLDRLEKEIEIIAQMDFAAYFLINWDILQYAQKQNYYYVGRGSGANSLVAYLLRITDVDPIALDLYFERFINPFRSSPPDFDIDFSWTDRDDITRYIFERFGKDGKAALLGSYNTFQRDAVIRELGKVFGLPPHEIDKLQSNNDPSEKDEIGRLVLRYSEWIHGFPSHLSIHASGILISEEPITTYTATFMPPKGYPTTHFSMLEAEDIGLFKFDILSQRGLGKIKDTLSLVQQNRGISIDIHDMSTILHDAKVADLLRKGKAIGCFYVESPAMRILLCKLQADDYLRLVAASSIIRPGVARSGMMQEYIRRYRNTSLREKAREALPELYDILKETYGVMVYQEDVIKVAHIFAGLSLAEADYLRRGMSWKFKQRNEFWRVKEQFFNNCRKKGYTEKTITDIWFQIESFANYAFSKGHSASYAVESYQALYLKAYFPIEYMVATLNNGGGFYGREVYLHEAALHGATIEPPCINRSEIHTTIKDHTIIIGLGHIAEGEQALLNKILQERTINGSFLSLENFIHRLPDISIEQLRLYVRIDAFRFTGKNKRHLLWEAHLMRNKDTKKTTKQTLFYEPVQEFTIPTLEENWVNDAFDEVELLGHTLRLPFFLLKENIEGNIFAKDLQNHVGKIVHVVGYLVTNKPTSTHKGERMNFGTFLDENGDWIDTVHFPDVAKAFPFTGRGIYHITGKVVEEFDFISIEVMEQRRLKYYDREESTRLKKVEGNLYSVKSSK